VFSPTRLKIITALKMEQRQSDHVNVTEEQEEMAVGPMLIDKLEVSIFKDNEIAIWFQLW
jgi:archaeosine-15-forming tRNA-guanine transglycosylase